MSTEQNKSIVRRWIEEGWNKGNLGMADHLYAADVVQHDPGSPAPVNDRAALKQYVSAFLTALPDLHFAIDELIAEGDKVLWRFTSRGTQTGPLMNIPPSGKTCVVTGMALFRLSDGKIAEVWVNYDLFGLLQQLGVIPVMA
jgi:steroid delta-isomerase-like uncharacterized protein